MNSRIVNPEIMAVAQRNQSAILSTMAHITQARVAELMGTSESTVSRFKDKDLADIAAFLAACGLKVVDRTHRCVSAETYQFLTATHARVMQKAPQLIWDTEE